MISAMSSSKHEPVPRKRQISEVEPEFPSLPMSSLAAAQQFAEKSQEALLYVKRLIGVDLKGKSSLFLPLISPHKLDKQFKVKEKSVFTVVRKAYALLKNDVDSLNLDKYCGICVRGHPGTGKSHLLYLLAAEYRMNRQSCRVTYINDCAKWEFHEFGYILKELVTTFYDDNIGGKSIVEWCQAVTGSEKKEAMRVMIEALIAYVKEQSLTWIVICDEYNAFYTHSVVKFPFKLISYLSRLRGQNIKVLISASANNDGYPTEIKGWNTHEISSRQFDQDEFKVWCDHYQLDDNVDPESDEMVDAFFWTGGVPHELDLLWNQPKEKLIGKTLLYRRNRVNEIVHIHVKFSKKLSDEMRTNLKECICRMALGLSPPKTKLVMDRELFVIVPGIDGKSVVTCLNPVARHALFAFYGQGLIASLSLVADLVFDSYAYSNVTKEKIVVRYITTMVELSKRFSFKSRKTTSTARSRVAPVLKTTEISSIIHFFGDKLPPYRTFNRRQCTLFVPISSNYPGFDFFIWNSDDEDLMAFQVAIKQPFSSHPNIDDNDKLWLDFCFGGLVRKQIQRYWIIPQIYVGCTKVFKGNVILLEELYDDFPSFKKLCLDRN